MNYARPNERDFAVQKECLAQFRRRLPVTFCLNGKKVELTGLRRWDSRGGAEVQLCTYTGVVEGITVLFTLHIHRDYPVLSWDCTLRNDTDRESGRLTEVRGVDLTLPGEGASLRHWSGDFCHEDGFAPSETILGEQPLVLAPSKGRPCDSAFPYFRLLCKDRVISAALGWGGQWEAQFCSDGKNAAMLGYQQTLDTTLQAGEEILLPSCTLLFSGSDEEHAIVLWRRYYFDHLLPRPDGKPLPPHFCGMSTEQKDEFTGSTDAVQEASVKQWQELGLKPDYWWVDAGWYELGLENGVMHWHFTGTWKPDHVRFPNGLRPTSDLVREAFGADFLLWFEPERVYRDSEIWTDHPEWVLKRPEADLSEMPEEPYARHGWRNGLLNLGNEAARRWLTDRVASILQDANVNCYRQDFNFGPLVYWQHNDAPGRAGMLENGHIRGYLRFWDDLLERCPGLIIDSCSSGGRRNDIETIKRSVPLHYSDYGYGIPKSKTAFMHTMFEWMPYFKEHPKSFDRPECGPEGRYTNHFDPFDFHCSYSTFYMLTYGDSPLTEEEWDGVRRYMKIWEEVAPMLYGDFYALAPFGAGSDRWVGWQFDSPEKGEGMLRFIRHADCEVPTFTAKLRNLEAHGVYVLTDLETRETFEKTGEELKNGLTIALPARSGRLLRYKKKA